MSPVQIAATTTTDGRDEFPSTEAYPIKSICYFCGSASDVRPSYIQSGADLVNAMKARSERVGTKMSLVYGGGDWGMMGSTARMGLEAGLEVIGVVPEFMRTTAGETHGETEWVESMAERKARMCQLSDCFVALPGGLGTMDELTEMLTWNQLGLISKPVGLLNVDGFYDGWVEWVDRATEDGLIKQVFRDYMFVEKDAERLLNKMASFVPSPDAAKFKTKA